MDSPLVKEEQYQENMWRWNCCYAGGDGDDGKKSSSNINNIFPAVSYLISFCRNILWKLLLLFCNRVLLLLYLIYNLPFCHHIDHHIPSACDVIM